MPAHEATMKRSFSAVLLSIALFTVAALATNKSLTAPAQTDASARISRIENGLLPAVIIKGQTAPAATVAERMAHFKVPGVSVAFFENGKIAWTRTYGFADLAANKPI